MDLKQLLGEELYNQVTSKLGDKKIMVDDGNFIPKARFDKVNDQKKELETQLKTSNETIETLKKNNVDNETLQSTISEHEKTIEKLKKEAEDKDFSYSLRGALKEAGCIDSKALEVYLTKEKLKLEEGKIVGLEEQLNSLKESKTYLFEDSIPQDTGGLGNFNRNTATGGQTESLGERLAKQATESNQSNQHNYFGGAK
ncbi:phage scaffolding protein [Paraclostridium bifermentans]|uniref:phage scaffolding protein n=1 Tax=Paraclostridium bifermentans TaxID=1490 RepID=UPI0006B365C2|nr:phage scaffolding protein [Paraclostridium bifermentans]MBS5952573.1 phage scaffolding protein [Paraclostridium bifermentans]